MALVAGLPWLLAGAYHGLRVGAELPPPWAMALGMYGPAPVAAALLGGALASLVRLVARRGRMER